MAVEPRTGESLCSQCVIGEGTDFLTLLTLLSWVMQYSAILYLSHSNQSDFSVTRR